MEIIQVVKRFGLCGGMEEYVFRLSEELCKKGIKVKVLCEVQFTDSDRRINVIKLGQGIKKPRWLSHIIFARKVSNWLNKYSKPKSIVHSHERITSHHVTTIHSTLFNFPKKGLPSFRKYMNEYLEKREMDSKSLKKIVPVSHIIEKEIKKKFPFSKDKLIDPIPPGITKIEIIKKKFVPDKPVIGFMGKEWKRKGLPKVIEIWRSLRKKINGIELCLAGFPPHSYTGISNNELDKVQILGYVNEKKKFFGRIDILLHPAKKEAYGMVIAEASSVGVPVVISKQCGAAEDDRINPKIAIDESLPIMFWESAIINILNSYSLSKENHSFRNWKECSSQYEQIYMKF
jgi:UDP-glucose:(heptosyl)LPS alpha-1,3-glucosyltransferase